MSTIEEGFNHAKDTPSNVHEHIPILAEYAEKCTSVVELGVDRMTTTWAFLKGIRFNKKKKKTLLCVDIQGKPEPFDSMAEIAKKNRITMEFLQGNSSDVTLPKSDLLYIDTAHHYALLSRELAKHHSKINKYIIMHNTEIDGKHGEVVRMCYYADIATMCQTFGYKEEDVVKGLQSAIVEFLEAHKEWKIEKHLPNNNGLTILVREEAQE
jgi:hypothetical protein